jgi:hypothetical protein
MNTKEIETIVIELTSLLRKGQTYFNDNNLSDRYKIAPDWENEEYNQTVTFNDYVRQQAIKPFYSKWLKDIDRVGKKLKETSPNDYPKVKVLLNDLPFKELGWEKTLTNEMDLTLQNLEKAIDYLKNKYSVEAHDKFDYDPKKQKLIRGKSTVIDFMGQDTNQHEVVRQLFATKNSGKEMSSTEFINAPSKSNRWLYTVQRDINKIVGVELILRKNKVHIGENYDVLFLNKDFI